MTCTIVISVKRAFKMILCFEPEVEITKFGKRILFS